MQDRVAIELRTHLVDKIYSVERTSFQAAVRDKKNRTPLEGRLGHEDWRQERPNSKSKKQFLEQEHEMRKLQILKEISIAEAEENVMKRIVNEGSEVNTNAHASRKPLIDCDDKDNDERNKIKD